MVQDAIARSDPDRIIAAAAIGYDRSFRSVDELAGVETPMLVIPGIDASHPRELAARLVETLQKGKMASVAIDMELRNAEDFADAFSPHIRQFLKSLERDGQLSLAIPR
jgi:hypothetical protein